MKINVRRSLIQICLLAAVLALPAVAQAQFIYTTNNGAITITGYTGSGGAVTIPATINGLPVTSIGDHAFYATGVTVVTIPASVTNLGDEVFVGSTRLTVITVDTNNPVYSSVNGVLFDKSQTTLVEYPDGLVGGYMIPNSVTSIGHYAFDSCGNLTNVTIPDSVTNIGDGAFEFSGLTRVMIGNSVIRIGENAFAGCTGLASVTIGNSVTSIGDQAFNDCGNLTSVMIGNSVTSIGGWAFGGDNLTSVTIGNSVTSIGDAAFYGCLNLTNITIPDSVISIGDSAFYDCESLTSVAIKSSVMNIGVSAFNFCLSLRGITVDTNNPSYSSVDGVLFDKSQATLIQYPASKAGSIYTIPDSVTNIEDFAFAGRSSLTSVTIPNGVNSLGFYTFSTDGNLTSVYFTGNAPVANDSTFVVGNFNPYYNATAYYLPGTTGWDDFSANTGIPAIPWQPLIQTGDASLSVRTNQFGFNIAWASGQTVVVEACTGLTNPLWQSVQTNTLTSDSSNFNDPQSSNYPARFYRLRSP